MATGLISPDARLRIFTDSGLVSAGAKLNTYVAGTPSTPLATYSDVALTIPNANPIVASAGGLFGPIYLTPNTSYKFVLTDALNNPIWTQDNVPAGFAITSLTNHGVVIGTGSVGLNSTSAGTAGQVLTSNGAAADPTFQATSGPVAFPAVEVPSSNANTLDDYEEGTWTPVLGGSGGTTGQTYNVQEGRYIKIGSLVWCACRIGLTNKGTITGNVEIQGLPFTAENNTLTNYQGSMNWFGLATAWVYVSVNVAQNTTTAPVVGATAAATSSATPLVAADIANTTILLAAVVYRAAN